MYRPVHPLGFSACPGINIPEIIQHLQRLVDNAMPKKPFHLLQLFLELPLLGPRQCFPLLDLVSHRPSTALSTTLPQKWWSPTFSALYKLLHSCCKLCVLAHLLFNVSFGLLFLLMLCRSVAVLLLYECQPGNLRMGSWDVNDDARSFFELLTQPLHFPSQMQIFFFKQFNQVNRLKLIKRQAYGQAGFDLLRHRVLARSA
jgi:hypothetical protein